MVGSDRVQAPSDLPIEISTGFDLMGVDVEMLLVRLRLLSYSLRRHQHLIIQSFRRSD